MDAEREAREVLGSVTKNWSFEMHIGCPDLASEIESAIAAALRRAHAAGRREGQAAARAEGRLEGLWQAIGVAVSIESRSPIRRAIIDRLSGIKDALASEMEGKRALAAGAGEQKEGEE